MIACNSMARVKTDEAELHSALERLMLGNSPAPVETLSPSHVASSSENGIFRLLAAVPTTSLQQQSFAATLCALWFDDLGDKPPAEFQEEWQELLRMNNLFQFSPRFVSFTRHMVEKGLVANAIDWLLDTETHTTDEESESSLTEAQVEELDLLDPTLQEALVPLLKVGSIPWPEFGYEAIDDQGRCGRSMLEVSWPKQKVGIALPTNDVSDFENSGWTVIHISDLGSTDLKALLTPKF
jgi:hypothetical protein